MRKMKEWREIIEWILKAAFDTVFFVGGGGLGCNTPLVGLQGLFAKACDRFAAGAPALDHVSVPRQSVCKCVRK